MSKRWPLKPKAMKINWVLVILIVFIGIPVVIILDVVLFFGHDVDVRQQHAEKAYKTIKIPDTWEFRNSTEFGDEIDDTDHVGEAYNYRTKDSPEAATHQIQDRLKAAGFTITEREGSVGFDENAKARPVAPDADPVTYNVYAEKKDAKVEVHFNISRDKGINYISADAEGLK